MKNINRIYQVINKSVFTINGTLDYDRVTDSVIALVNAIQAYDGDTEDWIYLGECNECCLSDFIVGAYWHYTEWHGGQSSKGYAALCALGQIFDPGMSSIEDDSSAYSAYQMLNNMADSEVAA